MITPYSKGLENVREDWIVLPGMDRKYVVDKLPTPPDVIQKYAPEVDINKQSPEEKIKAQIPDLDTDLLNTALIDVNKLDTKVIAQSVGNPELDRHLKNLFRAMRDGNFKAAVSGGFLRINYPLPAGDTIDMVYDMRPEFTDGDGIKLKSYLEVNDKKHSMDLRKLMGKTSVKFKAPLWYEYLLSPNLMGAGMSIGNDKISIHSQFFKSKFFRENYTPAMAAIHESGHKWFSDKYPELTQSHGEYILTQAGLMGVDFLSVLLALGINPWYILPSVILNGGLYMASRDLNTDTGKRAHASLANESHSDYVVAVMGDYFRRKGFNIGKDIANIKDIRINFISRYMLAYQPIPWGLVDLARVYVGDVDLPRQNPNEQYATLNSAYVN